MKRKWVRIALSVLVTVLFFYYFFRTVDFAEVASYAVRVDPIWLIIAAAAYCVNYPVRAFRIFYLTRNSGNRSYLRTMKISFRHQFYGRIIPFKVGDLSLVYLLKTRAGVSAGEGGAVLLLIRMFDGVIIILSFLICNLFVKMQVLPPWVLIAILAIVIAALFCAPFLLTKITDWLERSAWGAKPLMKKVTSILSQIRDMLALSVATPKNFAVCAAASLVMWFFVYLSMHGVIRAFVPDISFAQTVVASFLASAAAFLPINGIGGFGMVETGWALGFTLLGLDRATALSSGVVSNTMSFLLICLFGLISYLPWANGDRNENGI